MTNRQFTVSNTDRPNANSFTVPGDEDGGENEPSVRIEPDGTGDSYDSYIHIENAWDVTVDVTLQGSHYLDEDMNSATQDGPAVTIPSGEIDFFDIVSNHVFAEVLVEPAGTPTSGDLVVTVTSKER